jgi:hypothetical protein
VRNTFGKSHATVARIFGHLPPPTIDAIAAHNAAQLFKIAMPAA